MAAPDEKLRWLETRINSSLHPRNEDLKHMMQNDENRLAFHEFLNNEDVRRLFVYIKSKRQIMASLHPPHDLNTKSVFFLKSAGGAKLTRENIGDEVAYIDCSQVVLDHVDMLTREVYLPLLCTDNPHITSIGINPDKLMDVLHRLMATVEITEGQKQGNIVLPLPSIEVLAEAANNANRRGAVLHVLESTVIGWIKQIRSILKHDPILDLERYYGQHPGPLDELAVWNRRLEKLHSINQQLDSAVAVDILRNLEEANSTYAHSFQHVRKEIAKSLYDTEENLKFLSTLKPLFEDLHEASDARSLLRLFPPLVHNLLLCWSHSKYYHQPEKFHNLLCVTSNEVVHRAEAMVGEDVLREPLESYSKLKEALKVCASFRGTYLDYREKADEINTNNVAENKEKLIHRPQGMIWTTKLYGRNVYTPKYGVRQSESSASSLHLDEELWMDSQWPPRNAPCFDLLNSFMERCNDVLELVQTTRHFRLLADAAEVGGAGTQSLDALVKEIQTKYDNSMSDFFSVVDNVLAIDGSQAFEKAFFTFRTIVKDLEKRLADILRQSFAQCHTIAAQLRLLEVFEGISGRELVQANLKDKDLMLVRSFTDELVQVRGMFEMNMKQPPLHANMPPVVSRLFWIHALKQRIEIPMDKMKRVSPHSLEGDLGWQLRDAYQDAIADFERYESRIVAEWQGNITAELSARLKQPLLVTDETVDERGCPQPKIIHVNLDPNLLLLLREIHYLSQHPFCLHLPSPARELLRNTNHNELRVTATRLGAIVAKYNTVMKTITDIERPLFVEKLNKIDTLFEGGLAKYTWRTDESADFIEQATALVSMDVHKNLDIVQTNCHDIALITASWSNAVLDIFQERQPNQSFHVDTLVKKQKDLEEELENFVTPSGNRIHLLLQASFDAVRISQASPAWEQYVKYVNGIVLDGLKHATLASLNSMLNTILQCNTVEGDTLPILTIRLELIENTVAFRPPLDESSSMSSVQETVKLWLDSYLQRGQLVNQLGGQGNYERFISSSEEVVLLLEQINMLVQDNGEECKTLFELFADYEFLWMQDVNQTFEDFLHGNASPNPLRLKSPSAHRRKIVRSTMTSRASSAKSSTMSESRLQNLGEAEKSFLTPKTSRGNQQLISVPSLDEFDAEIDIYRNARDEILSLQDYQNVGWLRVDLQPIKQVLTTYASKWMWTFTKYLSDQVSSMLEGLDAFLKRTEPAIEGITGEERDTASFMKMMRLFNEVSAQQLEMDGKFSVMQRTVQLLKRYGQKLPAGTQQLFSAAPGRWNNLKTKVSLAKQRLGPRIQEESDSITKDLEEFGDQVVSLHGQLEDSEVYSRECSRKSAMQMIEEFVSRLIVLENEAQDLIELQDLLETSVVDFSILPQCRHDLSNLKQVWETVRIIEDQQEEWKRHRWQKLSTKFLRDETNKQLDIVRSLVDDVFTWDVYNGLYESITVIQACLPLIDDLSNPAMRTRHWKQLVRVTGGALQIDNDTLKRMTLGELLGLGLQKHVDDVRAIVQRAVKDLSIEQSLKTYEEVWLSKIFELRPHVQILNGGKSTPGTAENVMDAQSEVSQSEAGSALPAGRGQLLTTGRMSNQSTHSRVKRSSISSLPQSLINLGEDNSGELLLLLTNTEPIFEELERHQVKLQAMQGSSAAGSFLDEVLKWQKRLQTIEAVLSVWLQVQQKWVELQDVYSGADIKTILAADANLFAVISRDFRLLMKASEKNPNVLQCCSRKNIQVILEKMNSNLEQCHRSLLRHLEHRRQRFPRFYFLSLEDVLHIVCNGYDLGQINFYINKLYENVGCMIYEGMEDNERCNFQVTAVRSMLGEELIFRQPMLCEGSIETWLSNFQKSIKMALQRQLCSALGLEKAAGSKTREIHSAGARRVTISRNQTHAKNTGKERSSSRSGSRLGTKQEPGSGGKAGRRGSAMTGGDTVPSRSSAPSSSAGDEKSRESWILGHVAEVVYLVTQIQMSQQIQDALHHMDGGTKGALQVSLEKVNKSMRASVMLLKGLEGEKERQQTPNNKEPESDGRSVRDDLKDKEMTDTASESTSFAGGSKYGKPGSLRGSTLELNQAADGINPHATIPEEEPAASATGAAASAVEPTTAEPVDTMNLSAVPVFKQQDNEEEEIQVVDDTGIKLMLFPSQIQKLTSVIALLAHQRDLVTRLGEKQAEGSSGLAESFEWQTQLRYKFDAESHNIQIKCLDAKFEYGFEYMGSSPREVITPFTERCLLSLTQAIKANMASLCIGPPGASKLQTVHELSKILGQPLYSFNCTEAMNHHMLTDIFKGFAMTGCWILFNNINNIGATVLSVLAQLLTAVHNAFRAGKPSVTLQSEEVQLTGRSGACFALMDSTIRIPHGDPDKLLIFNSATAQLPRSLLDEFRTVTLIKPNLKLSLEVMLLSQGFVTAASLSHKTLLLCEMFHSLITTNLPITHSKNIGFDARDGQHGWSQQSLKYLAMEAGAVLEQITASKDNTLANPVEICEDQEEKQETGTPEKEEVPAGTVKDESEALVMALRNVFMPRLSDRDASIFSTLIQDLWPCAEVPMVFQGQGEEKPLIDNRPESSLSASTQPDSRTLMSGRKSKNESQTKLYRDSVNLNTPLVSLPSAGHQENGMLTDRADDEPQALESIEDAIAVATKHLQLLPGVAFQARVAQLAQLNATHQTILVVGPPGCGKSEAIKTFALAEKERGKTVDIQSLFNRALETDELFGYTDPDTRLRKDGLIQTLLRKFCNQPSNSNYDINIKPVMKILQLDGQVNPTQMELMESMLNSDGAIVLGNNERILVADTLRFIWELESLSHLSPSLLSTVGVLAMDHGDVGWQLILAQWLDTRPEGEQDILRNLCDLYMEPVFQHLQEQTRSAVLVAALPAVENQQYRTVVAQTDEGIIKTFTALYESLVNSAQDLEEEELERYFNFAAVWAFGGTLEPESQELFSHWWRQTFSRYIDYPEAGTVFDYMIESEHHEFVNWYNAVPPYSATPHGGIPSDAFVHTVSIEKISHVMSLLSDYGHPVMLVGEDGCGKTSLVSDRIRTVCSGEVAEVLALVINTNRFTNARLLHNRLDEKIEWKHGCTYVPKGNKKLLCLIDDLNLAQVDEFGNQTAVELLRQHVDDGGFYSPDKHQWKYIKNVYYVTTLNPRTSATVPKLSQRLLRHFAVFNFPYPRSQELETIFTTLLHTHFITPEMTSAVTISASTAHHLGINDEKVKEEDLGMYLVRNVIKEEEEALKNTLSTIVRVNMELQTRLRTMFLPTAQRCHYIFTMRDMGNIFRNLCLSLRPGCSRENVLNLWEHECWWMYAMRMVNRVDVERYQLAFSRAVRKEFTNEDNIQLLLQREKPAFSNLIEQDSGMVTAGNFLGHSNTEITEEESKTDLYKATFDLHHTRALLLHGVEEYNKTHPRIKLPLYKSVVEEVCRLSRTFAAPHGVAHSVLVAEGSPGRCLVIAKLAAHLCGYHIFQINPTQLGASIHAKIEQFKADLVVAYTRAGVKGEHIVFLLTEEELATEDFLVFVIEFIVSGAITHLFSYEEQTTIINSVRTEVTQAGLTYTREVAWDFFLRTVRKNFRVCMVSGSGSGRFQRRCREYPILTKNVNFVWFPHWSRQELVEHALFHLQEVEWMPSLDRENIAHLLSSMHLVLRQEDGREMTSGQYKHLTNTTFEKFVERFISMASARYEDIHSSHKQMALRLTQINSENALAEKLQRQLEHEKIVLEERKAGTVQILAQIGQDTAITEQQIKIVKVQMDKIQRLKKLLPEYQVAHERAVYKAIAVVADTKKVVQQMDIDSLSELRGMQKPIIDIEDLMAAIIMILKSPSADLTWQKGAKRQMANLERFIEELMSFDDNQLPEPTLSLVEPYLKKASFDPETMERKTENAACGSLCKWVRGVVRYHRMMISKVKPLHSKVEQTMTAIDNAEHKMSMLENKRKALEIRLADLARGFEEATIDKNDQEEKTLKMDKMLETAAKLHKILRAEYLRCQQIYASLSQRQAALSGGVAIAAGFATYLGPYHCKFRQQILTMRWPRCLQGRGILLVIDSIDMSRGRVVDFAMDDTQSQLDAQGDFYEGYDLDSLSGPGKPTEKNIPPLAEQNAEPSKSAEGESGESNQAENENTEKGHLETKDNDNVEEALIDGTTGTTDEVQKQRASPSAEDSVGESSKEGAPDTDINVPLIKAEHYQRYVHSLVKLLVGEETLYEWIRKDFGPSHIENAAIVFSSWQRPPFLLDPYGEGISWLSWLSRSLNKRRLLVLDMDNRNDSHVMGSIEKAIIRGLPVLLKNSDDHSDSVVAPLIHHRNTARETHVAEESRMIKFMDRRIMCHEKFRLYLATPNPKPSLSPEVASTVTLINYGTSNETIMAELLSQAFSRLRPALYRERRRALKTVQIIKESLRRLSDFSNQRVQSFQEREAVGGTWSEHDVQVISRSIAHKLQMTEKLRETQCLLASLDGLREELHPLARRGALLYAILKSLAALQHEYQFPLPYFLQLFKEVVGKDVPPDYREESDTEEEEEDKESGVEEHKGTMHEGDNAPDLRPPAAPAAAERNKEEEEEKDRNTTQQTHENSANKGEVDAEKRENEDDEALVLPPIDMPDVPELPSQGVEYNSLSANQVKQVMDKLTSNVYHKVKQSISEEHRLLFATMLCLGIQSEIGEDFSHQEMAMLMSGNPGLDTHLSLAEFGVADLEPPHWLAADKWDDVMAISVLDGPLENMCVSVAQHSEQWREWYKSADPENQSLPPISTKSDEGEVQKRAGEDVKDSTQGEMDAVSAFHKLLIVRMLRPDRLTIAMSSYVQAHLNLSIVGGGSSSVYRDLQAMVGSLHAGVLILMPPRPAGNLQQPLSSLSMTRHPADILQDVAKKEGISVQRLILGDGLAARDLEYLSDEAEKNQGWLIIQDLHLAPPIFLAKLKRLLREKIKENASSSATLWGNFLIWLTTEPCHALPIDLLSMLHKVAWDRITTKLLSQPEGATAHSPATRGHNTAINNVLTTAIVSALNSLPASHWDMVRTQPASTKTNVFGICVVQGLVLARQTLGARGLSQCYPLGRVQLCQAVELILDNPVKGAAATKAKVDQICHLVATLVYGNVTCSIWDQNYITLILQKVLHSLNASEAGTLRIGNVDLPIPPANVDPANYGGWFGDKMGEKSITRGALLLNELVDRDCNEAAAIEFLDSLGRLYTAQSKDVGDIQPPRELPDINMFSLRNSLDLCLERLPPLLELGRIPEKHIVSEYSFPYHRPSVMSFLTTSSTIMPESMGFTLLQECLWLNSLLCYVRQNLHSLQKTLLSGQDTIPASLLEAAHSLHAEHVPVTWLHPNCQPSTHTLLTWLQDTRRRHLQMHNWVKSGMVPTFTASGDLDDKLSRGVLQSVWLGGLVNPQALFTALRQEKAVISECFIDQVELVCDVSSDIERDTYDVSEEHSGLFIRDLFLQGAAWDVENDCLSETQFNLSPMPSVYVQAVLKSDLETTTADAQPAEKYICPVYMNKARQVSPLSLPLNTKVSADHWSLAGAALIVDPGIPEDVSKRTRTYAASKGQPPVLNALDDHITSLLCEEEEEGEEEEEKEKEEGKSRSTSRESSVQQSKGSQLSNKPASTNNSPLPPELAITKERPMGDKGSTQHSSRETVQSRTLGKSGKNSPVISANGKASPSERSSAASRKSRKDSPFGSAKSRGSEGSGGVSKGSGKISRENSATGPKSPVVEVNQNNANNNRLENNGSLLLEGDFGNEESDHENGKEGGSENMSLNKSNSSRGVVDAYREEELSEAEDAKSEDETDALLKENTMLSSDGKSTAHIHDDRLSEGASSRKESVERIENDNNNEPSIGRKPSLSSALSNERRGEDKDEKDFADNGIGGKNDYTGNMHNSMASLHAEEEKEQGDILKNDSEGVNFQTQAEKDDVENEGADADFSNSNNLGSEIDVTEESEIDETDIDKTHAEKDDAENESEGGGLSNSRNGGLGIDGGKEQESDINKTETDTNAIEHSDKSTKKSEGMANGIDHEKQNGETDISDTKKNADNSSDLTGEKGELELPHYSERPDTSASRKSRNAEPEY